MTTSTKSNILVLISYFIISLFVFWKLFFLPENQRLFLTSDFVQYWNILYHAASRPIEELFFDPYSYLGSPLIGRVDLAIFYPPVALLVVTSKLLKFDPFTFYKSLELLAVIHLCLGGFFGYLLAKRFVKNSFSAFLAGIAFVFSGYFLVSLNAFPLIHSSIWVPLLAYSIIRYVSERKKVFIFLTATTLSLTYLAGIPQITLYSFIFGILLYSWINCWEKSNNGGKFKDLAIFQFKTLFFTGLIILVPLIFQLPASISSNRSTMSYINTAFQGNISPIYIADYFLPHFFDSETNIVKSYFSQNYLGALTVLCLFIFPFLIKKAKSYFFFFAFFFFLLLGFGGETVLHDLFYLSIPGIKLFRNISKLNLLVSLSGAMVLAIVIDRLLDLKVKEKQIILSKLFQLALISFLIFSVLSSTPLIKFRSSLSANPPVAQEISIYKTQVEDIAIQGVMFFVTISLIILLIKSKQKTYVLLLLTLFFIIDISRFNHRVPQNNSSLNPSHAYSTTSYLQHIKNDPDEFRVSYPTEPLPANYAPEVMDIENIGGYSSLIPEVGSNLQQLLAKYSNTETYSRVAGVMNQKYIVSNETFNWPGYTRSFTYTVKQGDFEHYCSGAVSWIPCAPGKVFTVFRNDNYLKRIEILKTPEIIIENNKEKQMTLLENNALKKKDFSKFIILSETSREPGGKIVLKPVFETELSVVSGDLILISYPYDQNLILSIDNIPVSYKRANYGFIAYQISDILDKKVIKVSISPKLY